MKTGLGMPYAFSHGEWLVGIVSRDVSSKLRLQNNFPAVM